MPGLFTLRGHRSRLGSRVCRTGDQNAYADLGTRLMARAGLVVEVGTGRIALVAFNEFSADDIDQFVPVVEVHLRPPVPVAMSKTRITTSPLLGSLRLVMPRCNSSGGTWSSTTVCQQIAVLDRSGRVFVDVVCHAAKPRRRYAIEPVS